MNRTEKLDECFASFGLKSQTYTHLSGVDAFTKINLTSHDQELKVLS